jgi:hypothetical protein
MSEDKKPLGRPRGGRTIKMNRAQVEVFMKESMKVIFNEHLSYEQYVKWCYNQSISRSRANEYWNRVWEDVNRKFRGERDKLIDKHLLHYWDIYNQAKNEKDLSNARQVLDAIGKLMGLNEAEKINTESEVKITFNFGESETE